MMTNFSIILVEKTDQNQAESIQLMFAFQDLQSVE